MQMGLSRSWGSPGGASVGKVPEKNLVFLHLEENK